MPRKQRFKPSRKPKPPIPEISADTTAVEQTLEDVEGAQTARTQRDEAFTSAIEDAERGHE
jgi:hypothetical protein